MQQLLERSDLAVIDGTRARVQHGNLTGRWAARGLSVDPQPAVRTS